MAAVEPFRAVRYSGAAGSLADLVAPPYDAVEPEERERLRSRSPYNVVHLTLPESAEAGGRAVPRMARGRDPRARGRAGSLASLRGIHQALTASPGSGAESSSRSRSSGTRRGRCFPTSEPIRASGRRGSGCCARYGCSLSRSSCCRTGRSSSRTRRVRQICRRTDHGCGGSKTSIRARPRPTAFSSQTATIATKARSSSARTPGSWRYSSRRPIPVCTYFRHTARSPAGPTSQRRRTGRASTASSKAFHFSRRSLETRSAAVAYRRGRATLIRGSEDELDVELVDRYGLDGIGYTSQSAEAVATVDRGDADVAFLLRAPRVEDVFAAARRGERMPPKSTYFFPKPLSGLLFHPVEP